MASAIKLKIRADASQAKRELKGLSSRSAALGKATKVLGAAFIAAAGATAIATKKTIDYGDWLEKTAQKTGVSVEALSQYRLGAELAGTSQEALVSGLQRLQKNMGAALRSPTSAAAVAFEQMGIAFKDADGNLRDLDSLLPEIAKEFSKMEDGTLKTGIAMDLMGRQGAELIPFLNAGADGLAAMREEADRLGITWSTKTAKAAAEFNDEVTRLKASVGAMVSETLRSWMPALADLAGGIDLAVRKLAGLDERVFSKSAVGEINKISAAISDTEDQIISINKKLEIHESMWKGPRFIVGDLEETIASLRDELARSESTLSKQEDALLDARKAYRGLTEAGIETRGVVADVVTSEDAKRVDALSKSVEGLRVSMLGSADAIRHQTSQQLALLNTWLAATGDWEKFNELQIAVLVRQKEALASLDNAQRASSRRRREDHQAEVDEIAAKTSLWSLLASERVRIESEASAALKDLHDREAKEAEERAMLRVERDRKFRDDQVNAQIASIDAVGTFAAATSQIMTALTGGQTEEAKAAAKVLFGVQQAAAFAVASLMMAQAISVASASAPPPFNVPAITQASITGAASLATIVGTTIQGLADAGLPPGALRQAGLNRHTVLAVRNDEMVLDPVGTQAISRMLQQQAGGGQPIQVNTTLELDGDVLGRTVDSHLIRSSERGLSYQDRIRY